MGNPIISWFDALDSRPYVDPRSPRSETFVLRVLEWSEEGHRIRAELRTVEGRLVWFVSLDDGMPREAFEASASDANLHALRKRLVRSVRQ